MVWTFLMWLFKDVLAANLSAQKLQLYFLKPSWTANICLFNLLTSDKVLLHKWQLTLNDLSLWTRLICLSKRKNTPPHKSHFPFLRPSWTFNIWVFKLLASDKVLLHKWQLTLKISSLWALLTCTSKCKNKHHYHSS